MNKAKRLVCVEKKLSSSRQSRRFVSAVTLPKCQHTTLLVTTIDLFHNRVRESTIAKEQQLDTTAIVEKSLWVPGQQLHGSMIPRPEDILYRNQVLETKQLDRLLLFEARLAALKAAEASGGGLERIRKRVSMIRRAEEPRASGFELVCSDEGSSDEATVWGAMHWTVPRGPKGRPRR